MRRFTSKSLESFCRTLLVASLASCGPSGGNPSHQVVSPSPSEPADEIALPDNDSHAFARDGDGVLVTSSERDVRVEGDTLTIRPHETRDADVAVTTKSVVRGDATMPMAIASSAVDDEGAVVLERALLRERYVAFDSHTAQQWTFDVEPEGTGPLVIRVGIDGARYRATTDEGLVLDVAGRTVLYGHGAFVSADGARTPVRASWDENVVLSVPADVLAASTYPATLDPTIRVESTIDAPVYGADRAIQSHPSVASRGDGALVVWSDYRTGRSYDVFGVRTDANGARLEAGSFPIVIANGAQWRPSAASNGTDYFVVWEDHRDGGSAIYGTRVEADGYVLDPAGVLLSDAGAIGYAPRIASDGANYLVVWERQDASARSVRGTRVSAAGVASASFEIEAGVNLGVREPVVAYGGDLDPHYVVGWEDLRGGRHNIRAARVSTAGVLVDTASIALTNDTEVHSQVAIAVNPARALMCFVSSAEVLGEPDADVHCVPLELDDGALGASFAAFSGAPLYDTPAINIAPDGGFHVLASSSETGGTDIVVSLVSSAGAYIVGPYEVDSSAGTQNAPCAVVVGGQSLVVFQDDRDGSTEIYARYVLANSPPTTPSYRLSTAAVRLDGVSVAWGGSGYVAVWHDARSSSGSILGARVQADGDVVDTTALALSETTGPALEPVAAGGDGIVLAVWREAGAIKARRISLTESLLEADALTVRAGSGLAHPAVVWNGTHFLVAWEEYVSGNYDIYARRYALDGTSPDATPIRVSTSPERSAWPTLATDGTSFYAAWTEGSDKRIDVTRITGGEIAFAAIPLVTAGVNALVRFPSIAFGAGSVLVVWESRASTGQSSIAGVEITTQGGPVPGAITTLANDTVTLGSPRVAFGGEDFLVAWERATGPENRDLAVQRFDAQCDPVEGTATTMSATLFDERSASLVSAGGSRWLVGFERFDPSDMFGNVRARLRFVDSGDGCVEDIECVSGACVDGACCDTACGGGETDCMACSFAAGGTADGTCGPLRASIGAQLTCRASAGECDVAETCSTSGTVCPTDGYAASSLACRPSAHLCDPVDFCTGSAASCPEETSEACAPGDLAVAITNISAMRELETETYTLAVANVGAGPTQGTVTIVHTLPPGFTPMGLTYAPDWSCTTNSTTLTCTHAEVIWNGVSLTPIVFTVIPSAGTGGVVLTATISGMTGDANAANDTASVPVAMCGATQGGVACPCEPDDVEVGGLCEPFVACTSLDCAAENRTCSEVPNGHCLDACVSGYVWDGALGACRAPITCGALSCGYGCIEGTSSTDAECNAGLCPAGQGIDATTNECSACTGGATTCADSSNTTGRRLLANGAGSACLCETRAGYFYDQGTDMVVACDGDDDGWVTTRVHDELSSATATSAPKIHENARCTVRKVDRVVLRGDEAAVDETVMLASALPLFETDVNDGDISAGAGPSYPGPWQPGPEIPASYRNSFTKACIPPPGDVNDNGLVDVHEGPALAPVGYAGELQTHFAAYTRFSYYFELDVGYYVAPVGAGPGAYHVVERDRSTTAGTMAFPFDVDTPTVYGSHWRECGRQTDEDYTPGTAPTVGNGDFVEFAPIGTGSAWRGMDHPSQFKCVHYVRPTDYDTGVAPASGPISSEAYPQIVTWDPVSNRLRRTSRAGAPVDEYFAWSTETCAINSSYQPGGIHGTNPDMPTFSCESGTMWSVYVANLASWTGWAVVGYENAATGTEPYTGVTPAYRRGCENECVTQGATACPGYGVAGNTGMYCLMTLSVFNGHLTCRSGCAPGEFHTDSAPSAQHDYAMCGAVSGSTWTSGTPQGVGGVYTLRGAVDVTGIGTPTNGTTVTPKITGGTYTLTPR